MCQLSELHLEQCYWIVTGIAPRVHVKDMLVTTKTELQLGILQVWGKGGAGAGAVALCSIVHCCALGWVGMILFVHSCAHLALFTQPVIWVWPKAWNPATVVAVHPGKQGPLSVLRDWAGSPMAWEWPRSQSLGSIEWSLNAVLLWYVYWGFWLFILEGWGKTCAFDFTILQCSYQLSHSHLQDDLANVDAYASQLGWYSLFKPKGKGNKYLGLDALVGVRFLPHTHTFSGLSFGGMLVT